MHDRLFTVPPTIMRRCPRCASVAPRHLGEGAYVCADPDCRHLFRPSLRCPRCLGVVEVDHSAVRCVAGCAPVGLPAQEPRGGWEVARADMLNATYDAMWGDPWGLDGMHHGVAWDRYSAPASALQARWGSPDDDGRETLSTEGAALAQAHSDDARRVGEMSDVLREFAAAVTADDGLKLRGAPTREALALGPCVVAAMVRAERPPQVTDAYATDLAAQGVGLMWEDPACRSYLIREVGAAAIIELHKCIVARGGSFAGISDVLRQLGGPRETPFAGYRHAVAFWCGDHGSTTLGGGSPLAGLGGATALFNIPCGPRFDEIAVKPTRNGGGSARNAGTWTMARDVEACVEAARVGGRWHADIDEGEDATKATAWFCTGGRPLAQWELALVQLCDFGTEVTIKGGRGEKDQREWRKLAVVEAVDRVRELAAQRRTDAQWGPARHLTTQQGKDALRLARRAIQDALEAWEMVPAREPLQTKRGARSPDPDADQPRNVPVPREQRAANSWDFEVPR